MTTIYRDNADRLSVADAKRLILETLPPETSGEVYARVDENGEIDFEGPIEVREVYGVQTYASFIDRDFLSMCEQLNIQPRMKYRPMFTGYTWKSSVDDTLYIITHNEFGNLAELFGLLVVTGKAPEPQATTPSPAPVPALEDEKQSIERIRYEVLASRSQLIEAFGYYGVELKIFKALKDRPGLLAACRVKGKGQKGSRAEPMFCPFEVINWLVKTGVKEKPRLENFMGWHILETKFPSVYAEKSIGDPRQN